MTEAGRHIKAICRVMPQSGEESCLIACPEARSIVASSKPISKHLLNSRNQKNLNSLKSILLEDSALIKFDGIIEESTSQSKLFNEFLKPPTQDLLTGKSLCVIVFGTTGSGKSYTLRGGEGKNRGLALRNVELLLSIIDRQRIRFHIKVSVIAIFDDKIVDLLSGITPPEEIHVYKTSDFHVVLNQALKNRKNVGDRHSKDKIHMIVTVKLYQELELLSEAYFVELAGSEYAREDKQVARSFNSISNQLTQSSNSWQSNVLSMYLSKGLDIYSKNPTSVFLICCASQNSNIFKDTLASLKFTSRIKECIEKDSVKLDLIQIDTLISHLGQSNLQDIQSSLSLLSTNISKLISQEKVLISKDSGPKHKQVQIDSLIDIQETKPTADQNLSKTLYELSQVRKSYTMLQEQYDNILHEKTQIAQNCSQICAKVVDEIVNFIEIVSSKVQNDQEIRSKLLEECKNVRNTILNKSIYREPADCNCSDDVKSLQKAIKDLTEDRDKIIERLESSIKENRQKEEYIQTLYCSSNTYEQKNQQLSSIVSDYENLIYELRKSLNSISSKASQLEEEKLVALQENERLKASCNAVSIHLDELKDQSELQILKYKHEVLESVAEYEKLQIKIESLGLELAKFKLNNNHLKIINKAMLSELESINTIEIDKKISSIYAKFEKFNELISLPATCDIDY